MSAAASTTSKFNFRLARKWNEVITLTFGDMAENHVGMQSIGQKASGGFTLDDLQKAQATAEDNGHKCEMYNLVDLLDPSMEEKPDGAWLLVIRKAITHADELMKEQQSLDWDKKVFMYGRVVNKKARYNLCFDEKDQEPLYEDKKGRIVSYSHVPHTAALKDQLPELLGDKAKNLVLEGNRYYDPVKCYIGWHGDAERKRVIGVRLGDNFQFCYQWYIQGKPVGDRLTLTLKHSDAYIMSEKATGHDWKKRKILTLRHAAGNDKHLEVRRKTKKVEFGTDGNDADDDTDYNSDDETKDCLQNMFPKITMSNRKHAEYAAAVFAEMKSKK